MDHDTPASPSPRLPALLPLAKLLAERHAVLGDWTPEMVRTLAHCILFSLTAAASHYPRASYVRVRVSLDSIMEAASRPLDGDVDEKLAEGYRHVAPRVERSRTDPNFNKEGLARSISSEIHAQLTHVKNEYLQPVSFEVCRAQTPPQLGVNPDYTFTLTLTDRINRGRDQA